MANSFKRIKSISGKLGPFIFRTHKNGIITAYYRQHKHPHSTSNPRDIIERLSNELREIADHLGLIITDFNVDYDE